jgi:hypothetical protein
VDSERSIGVKGPNTRRQRRLKNEKTSRLQIAKREDGSSVGSLKIRDWALWGVDPLLKEKKLKGRAGAGNVEAPAPNDTERKKMTEIHQGAARDEST